MSDQDQWTPPYYQYHSTETSNRPRVYVKHDHSGYADEIRASLRERFKEAGFKEADPVNHPDHYTWLPGGLEAIDLTEQFNFNLGNALKYIIRADHKGEPIKDLEKAVWYLQREIQRRKGV